MSLDSCERKFRVAVHELELEVVEDRCCRLFDGYCEQAVLTTTTKLEEVLKVWCKMSV